jgi:uncharacterized protein YcbX
VPSVAWLSIAPVKGLGLAHPGEVTLDEHGVTENRRFHLVDADGRMFTLIRAGGLVQVSASYDAGADLLALRFPDGTEVAGEIAPGEPVTTDFYGRPVSGRVVAGPWAEPLSRLAGQELRLVKSDQPGTAVDRGRGTVSLVSEASLAALGRLAGDGPVDRRRFRMLVGVEGTEPHEEDAWLGREVRIGEAAVRPLGTVGRCAITTQDPDSGRPDLDTLRLIRSYRGPGAGGGIDFGVYGEVVRPGRVRVGDAVEPL